MEPFFPSSPAGARPVRVAFESLSERDPGPKWQRVFHEGWAGWSDWLRQSRADLPPLAAAERALRRHMPELVSVWEKCVGLTGGDERAARFLTFWSPPRYLVHCTQAAVVDAEGPLLVRNYDLDPALNEGFLLHSAWLGRDVMGMVDGLVGLADGMNAAGLAVSLAFGGRPNFGRGFGVPLIVRYLLEVCRDVPDAVEALRGLPCHMSYNLTLIDRDARHATVFLAPDRPAIVTQRRFATNHQLGVEWPRHGRLSQTVERERHVERAVGQGSLDGLARVFLQPPLHSVRYGESFGTIYTALYRPAAGTMRLAWPGLADLPQSFGAFAEGVRYVTFTDGRPPEETPAPGPLSHATAATALHHTDHPAPPVH